jgi:hypothetical protein
VKVWIGNEGSFRLTLPAVLLLLLPWALDYALAYQRFGQSNWTLVFRLANILPLLLLLAGVLLDRAMNRPPEVHRNRHREMAIAFLGAEAPILETWYSQNVEFTGHGAEYLRLRFSPNARPAIQAALAGHCRAALVSEWSLLAGIKPYASSMPWDPPAVPVV